MNLSDIELTKWSRLVVVGEPVTVEQAYEILLRTCSLKYYPTSYPKQYTVGRFLETLDLPEPNEYGHLEQDEVEAMYLSIGSLDLYELENDRFFSCWVNGRHGWVNFDGKVFSNNYNIGKWPEADTVYRDICLIAERFPFLTASFQLCPNEGSDSPIVQFDINNGEATYKTTDLTLLTSLPTAEEDITEMIDNISKKVDVVPWDWSKLRETYLKLSNHD